MLESLHSELENAKIKIKESETENQKLRDSEPGREEFDEDKQELQHIKELYKQAVVDL